MSRLPEAEELELEPLLVSSDAADMAPSFEDQDFNDAKDVEKVDVRPASSTAASVREPSPEERRLVWKLDTRILPIVCILYLFGCEL